MTAEFQGLHGGQVMFAAVLMPAGGDTAHIRAHLFKHFLDIVIGGYAMRGGGGIGAGLVPVADGDKFGQRVRLIESGMAITQTRNIV